MFLNPSNRMWKALPNAAAGHGKKVEAIWQGALNIPKPLRATSSLIWHKGQAHSLTALLCADSGEALAAQHHAGRGKGV